MCVKGVKASDGASRLIFSRARATADGLSPFSTEAVGVLESTGAKFEKVELGPEGFLLGGKGSAIRNELGVMYGQTSLPHIFVGGEWIGGLYSGGPSGGGLAGLMKSGELDAMLQKAKAL